MDDDGNSNNKDVSEYERLFLKFYQRFSVDSAFQVAAWTTVEFTSADPDDDFSTQTGSIIPEQWPSFKPELIFTGVIYNIIYGQEVYESNQKIFVICGIANGLRRNWVPHEGWQMKPMKF